MDIDLYIFDFCYELALQDATIRSAFTGPLVDIRNINGIKVIIESYISALFNVNEDIPKPIEVINSIVELLRDYNDRKESTKQFRFGNVQKLVNMTVKYLYIKAYNCNILRCRFNNCHCPIDSQIIGKLKRYLVNNEDAYNRWNARLVEYRQKGLIKRRSIDTMLNNISFSNINQHEYQLCQEIIDSIVENDDEITNAIEFDYKYWGSITCEIL